MRHALLAIYPLANAETLYQYGYRRLGCDLQQRLAHMVQFELYNSTKGSYRTNGTAPSKLALRTFESIATEHIICADKLVLAPNFYYSLATVCYVLTKSFNF